jgi:hypothetical protein
VIKLTPAAYTELRQRVAALDEPDAGVAVSWLPAQRELIRTSEGAALWVESQPDRWVVVVMSLSELPCPDRIGKIGDLRVYFQPEGSGVQRVLVAFGSGKFDVRSNDA